MPDFDKIIAIVDYLSSIQLNGLNGRYQRKVANKILATGKTIDDLTIGEVREISQEAKEQFNNQPAVTVTTPALMKQ